MGPHPNFLRPENYRSAAITDDDYVSKAVKDYQAGCKFRSSTMAKLEEQECNVQTEHTFMIQFIQNKNKTQKTWKTINPIAFISIINQSLISRTHIIKANGYLQWIDKAKGKRL